MMQFIRWVCSPLAVLFLGAGSDLDQVLSLTLPTEGFGARAKFVLEAIVNRPSIARIFQAIQLSAALIVWSCKFAGPKYRFHHARPMFG